jgi:acyl carrier protein
MNTNQNSALEKVRDVVARTFKVSPETVTPQTSLNQLPGWDSLSHLTLMMEVERELSVRFPTKEISNPSSVGEICDLLRSMQSSLSQDLSSPAPNYA